MNVSTPLILIGGHGFLGRAYSAHATAAGREVHRGGRRRAADAGPHDWHWGEAEGLVVAVAGRMPGIIDLAYATVPSTSYGDPVGDFTANLGAVNRHLDFARSVEAGSYLYISSGGTVYGDAAFLPLSEDAPTRPISPYGITKLAGEHYALMHARLGLPVTIARPSNIYGPGQVARAGQGLVAAAFAAALEGRSLTLFGDGSQCRDYLYIDDFCVALDYLLGCGGDGATYNVGSGVGVGTVELMAMIGDIVAKDGHRLDLDYADPRPFDVDANVLDPSRIAAATGWRAATGLADGLERSWRWMRGR
jgi:UDP-glucose 4-epimerase